MPKISSRSELKQYCLRKLGAPVLKINVADEQIEDAIDDAIQYFLEFHDDSTARILHKHQITPEDIEFQYIQIPEDISHIKRILPIKSLNTGSSSIFDPAYQMRLQDYMSFTHPNYYGDTLQYWYQWQEHMKMIEMQITGARQEIDFNRHEHELHLRISWEHDIREGDWLIIDAERMLININADLGSPEFYSVSDVYNNMFLKEYTTELIRYQWGSNMRKYSGMQLPGGITLDAEAILAEAKERIDELKQEMREIWENPPMMAVG